MKELGSSRAEVPRFPVASVMKQQKSLVQIEERGPDGISFTGKYFPGSRESFKRLQCFTLLAARDGLICQRFRRLIAHSEFLKTYEAVVSDCPRFLAEIELQINVRQVQLAQRHMIFVAGRLTSPPRGKQHFDGTAVFATEVVQVGNVVIGLIANAWHVGLRPQFHPQSASSLVAIQRSGKVIQTDQTHGHVAQGPGGIFPFLIASQFLVCTLVVGESLLEPILPMKYVADIVFQTGESLAFAQAGENFLRFFGSCECLFVLTNQDERLN